MRSIIKRITRSFVVFLLPLLPLSAQSDGENIRSTLRGEVIDRPQSSRLILIKQGGDPRFNMVYIPITNGKFEHILNCNHEEQYELWFYDEFEQGSVRPVSFFSENGIINFALHPTDQYDKNIVEGGKLNKEYRDFFIANMNKVQPLYDALNARRERLREEGNYYTPETQSLLDQMSASTDETERRALSEKFQKMRSEGLDITMAAKEVQKSGDSVELVMQQWKLQYARELPNIVGYSILMSEVNSIIQRNRYFQTQFDVFPHADVYQTIFAPKYPDHPYTAKMIDLFTGSSLKSGTPFIDFTAVDMNGKTVTLSERIAGKPTVLHLWASWCGPCRQKGKELIPVYEEFRDKGLVVVGIARERSMSSAEAAIKLDKYPWENLVELNDVEQIWVKYGIGNSGGSHFLIDEKGTVIAVAPSIEEIRDFLAKELK